jgi:hypothetical protein
MPNRKIYKRNSRKPPTKQQIDKILSLGNDDKISILRSLSYECGKED